MTEIKNTLAILKARWPEVTLIIGLYVLSLSVNKLHLLIPITKESLLRALSSFVFFILLIIIIVITILLQTGFQRTFYLEGQKRQSLMTLLRVGWHFFWRMVKFGLIYVPVFFILAWLTFLVIKPFATIETGFWETSEVAPFTYQLCFTAATLILIKPLLLIFPLIVVLDCRLFESFKLLKRCKLLHARELVILFFISLGVSFLWVFMPSIKSAITLLEFLLIVGRSILQQFIGLMIAVMAVRFVASLNLVYDSNTETLQSG